MKSAAPSTDRVFRFGLFELSEREGVLLKDGIRIKLQELPFRVLFELLENAGKLVTREELQQKLWPADTFVDFDVSLNTAIRKIRQALGDDADHPRYIETTAKRGYRFLVPVHEVSSVPAATEEIALPPASNHAVAPQPDAAADEPAPASQKRRGRYWVATAVAALAVVAILTQGRWRLQRTAAPVMEKRITANPAEAPIRAAVVSPDGKYLAYADTTGIYLGQMDVGETRRLPLPTGFAASPSSWFPDSTHLLVTWRDRSDQRASIWKISILGGDPQMLLDEAEDGVVSPDGSQIAFFNRSPAALYGLRGNAILHVVGELWLASADGQNPRRFVVPAETNDSQTVG
jgi:DNA-binding winged helix-turn-helix (wHTH) protein